MILLGAARDSITLWASDRAELTRLVVLCEILLQQLLVTSEVLADHLDIQAFLAVLSNIVVVDHLIASTSCVLTFDGQLGQRSLQHGVRLSSGKRLISAIRTHYLSLVLAEINIILDAGPAKAAFASVTLDRMLQHIEADTTV